MCVQREQDRGRQIDRQGRVKDEGGNGKRGIPHRCCGDWPRVKRKEKQETAWQRQGQTVGLVLRRLGTTHQQANCERLRRTSGILVIQKS